MLGSIVQFDCQQVRMCVWKRQEGRGLTAAAVAVLGIGTPRLLALLRLAAVLLLLLIADDTYGNPRPGTPDIHQLAARVRKKRAAISEVQQLWNKAVEVCCAPLQHSGSQVALLLSSPDPFSCMEPVQGGC